MVIYFTDFLIILAASVTDLSAVLLAHCIIIIITFIIIIIIIVVFFNTSTTFDEDLKEFRDMKSLSKWLLLQYDILCGN